MRKNDPRVKVYVVPGGKMPERKTAGAIGYDVFLRAVVSASEMDPNNKSFRKVLFDFENVPKDNPSIEGRIEQLPGDNGNELVYRMKPKESVLVGIGFVTEMKFPMFYWIAPRSGLASRWGITVTNAPGTVDPDYRGEAGVLVYNMKDQPFVLRKNMRIAQIIFQKALIPEILEVNNNEEIGHTERGSGGFGSTGVRN